MSKKQKTLYSSKALQEIREYNAARFEYLIFLVIFPVHLAVITGISLFIDASYLNRKYNRAMQFVWNFIRKGIILHLDVWMGFFTIINVPLSYIILTIHYLKNKVYICISFVLTKLRFLKDLFFSIILPTRFFIEKPLFVVKLTYRFIEKLFLFSIIFCLVIGVIIYRFTKKLFLFSITFCLVIGVIIYRFTKKLFLFSIIFCLGLGVTIGQLIIRVLNTMFIIISHFIYRSFHIILSEDRLEFLLNFFLNMKFRMIRLLYKAVNIFLSLITHTLILGSGSYLAWINIIKFIYPLDFSFNVLFYSIYHRNNIYDALKSVFNVSFYRSCCAYIATKTGLFLDKIIKYYHTLYHMFFTKPHTHLKHSGYHIKFLEWALKNNVIFKKLTEDMVTNQDKLDELYMDVQEIIDDIEKDPMQRPFYILLSGGNLYNIIDIINNFNNGFGMSRFAHNDYTSMSSQQYQGFKNKSELDFSKTDVHLLANRAKFLKNSGNKEYIELGKKLEDMIVYHLSDKKIQNKYLRTLKSIIDDLYSNSNRFSDINGDKTLELHNRYQKLMDEVDKDAPIQAKHLKSLNVLGGGDKKYRLERVMNLAFRKKSLNLYSLKQKKPIKYEDDGYCLASLHSIFSPLLENYIRKPSKKTVKRQPIWRRQTVSHHF